MRTARVELLPAHRGAPLVERGRIEKTFQGLGLFSATSVLLYGAYLLTKAMLEPLEASEMTVVGAGFTLSLASFAITYLLWPRSRVARSELENSPEAEEKIEERVLTIYREPSQNPTDAKQVLTERKQLPGPM